MESEPEGSLKADREQSAEKGAPKRKARPTKRDPNEEIPVNWQRRLHLADRMPVINVSDGIELEDDGLRVVTKSTDAVSYSVGDFVFVACSVHAPAQNNIEDFGDPPEAFRVARILELTQAGKVRVNWLLRPCEALRHSKDSRELYITFESDWIDLETLRGKCLVQCRQEIRNLQKFREKSSQFWFSKLYHRSSWRLYDVLPTLAMKSLGPRLIAELSQVASYAVVNHGNSKALCEQSRKRKSRDETPEEPSMSEKELKDLARRAEWPFRYFSVDTNEFSEPCTIPRGTRIGDNHQIKIDEWPGHPLVYYTAAIPPRNSRARQSRHLRYVESTSVQEPNDQMEVDESKPWVQEMPRGYIVRGGESTSMPVSIPQQGLSEFVSKCQSMYAESIEVHPSAVNFLDACCSIYASNVNNVENALVTVSRLSRKQLHEPDLQPNELETFKQELDPFLQKSWHEVFRAVGSKPLVELCQYYWVNLPLQPTVPVSQQIWDSTDPIPSNDDDENDNDENKIIPSLICAVCYTDSAPEWKSLPGYLRLMPRPEYPSTCKIAMCARCARLWYRYRTKWLPPTELEKQLDEVESSVEHEPELIDDTKTYVAESERRGKRRHAAKEKKEAIAKKREEARQAKKAAKEAKKLGKEVTSGDINGGETSSAIASPSSVEISHPDAASNSATADGTKPSKTKTTDGKSKVKKEVTKKGSKRDSSVSAASRASQDDQSSSEDESEVPSSGAKSKTGKKRAPAAANSASLMSLDQVDQMLDEIDEDLEPENAEYSNYCVVCGQLDPSMPQVTCASCGLNAHIACYGAPSSWSSLKQDRSSAWLCDCCSSSRGEMMSDTTYQCILCPPRVPIYGSWLNGVGIGAPDGLKSTIEKSWCHIRCALWTPGVRFGDPGQYCDIDVSGIRREEWDGQCKICLSSPPQSKSLALPASSTSNSSSNANSSGSGTTANSNNARGLDTADHATGSQANGGSDAPSAAESPSVNIQTDSNSTSSSKTAKSSAAESSSSANGTSRSLQNSIPPDMAADLGSKVKCDLCDDRFHVSCAADKGYRFGLTKEINSRPVIICPKHTGVDLIPMSRLDLNMNLSAMQLHVTSHKVAKRRVFTASERSSLVRMQENEVMALANIQQSLVLPLLEYDSETAIKTEDAGSSSNLGRNQTNSIARVPFTRSRRPHNHLKCKKCGLDSASYWHRQHDTKEVLCPLCFRGLTPMDIADLTDEENIVLREKLVSRVFSYLSNSRLPQTYTH